MPSLAKRQTRPRSGPPIGPSVLVESNTDRYPQEQEMKTDQIRKVAYARMSLVGVTWERRRRVA